MTPTTITVSAAERAEAIEALRSWQAATGEDGWSTDDVEDAGAGLAELVQSILSITPHELATED